VVQERNEEQERKVAEQANLINETDRLWDETYGAIIEKTGKIAEKNRFKRLKTEQNKTFPESGSELNKDDRKELKRMNSHLTKEEKATNANTQKSIEQLSALQYFPATSVTREYYRGKQIIDGKEQFVELLTPAWVSWSFDPVFLALVRKAPKNWFPVVVGKKRDYDDIASPELTTGIKIRFEQMNTQRCLFKSLASALFYCGYKVAANYMSQKAWKVESLPMKDALDKLTDCMREQLPVIGVPEVFNSYRQDRLRRRVLTKKQFLEERTPYPTVVIPLCTDGSVSHAFCAVDDLIFDSTQVKALKLREDSLDWICGASGCQNIYLALRFNYAHQTKAKFERCMRKNW
jgi:hypothetical protein